MKSCLNHLNYRHFAIRNIREVISLLSFPSGKELSFYSRCSVCVCVGGGVCVCMHHFNLWPIYRFFR
jgi:hypothetical protein